MEARMSPSVPELVTSDFTTSADPEVPAHFTPVGRVVHLESTPSFGHLGVLLEATIEVKPGQFLAAWHGRRKRNVLTVLQVGDCHEVNPNEEPQLAAARDRLGLAASYAGEAASTRIFRIASCETVEEFEISPPASGPIQLIASGAPEAL